MNMPVLGPILVVVALASAACSSGSTESSPSADRSASAGAGATGSSTLPPVTGLDEEPDQAAVNEALDGLTREEAEAAAEAAGYTVRVTREDDESFPMTMDYRTNRINIEIDDGRVTRAYIG